MENFYNRINLLGDSDKTSDKFGFNKIFASFSKRERILFSVFAGILLLSTILILNSINQYFMVEIPEQGGSVSIGINSIPRFINPILANSQADESLVALVYSGLMRKDKNGTLIPDLAEKYDISKNGLIYTFTLKNNLTFQNGKPVTADDVLFTINKIKDPTIKSPRKISWEGVTAEIIDQKNIKFTLRQPYASFLESTTLPIMPKALWENAPIELNNANISPIGSGPYLIEKTVKKTSGAIDYFDLVPFKKFALGKPYIKNLRVNFYSSEEELMKALTGGEVDEISSITPMNAEILREKNYKIYSTALPRVFGLFFNQNQNQIFVDKVVTRAINEAIDKDKIVKNVLFGYGTTIDNPIPPSIVAYQNQKSVSVSDKEKLTAKIQNDLAKDGWKKGASGFLEKTIVDKKKKTTKVLEFSISTGNAEELAKTAILIKEDLEKIGMKVDVKTFETGNLNQNVIRPRKYDALLFGEIINHESDLFAFWHSSQRRDPGLNVAMYTNAKVDKILEDASTTTDETNRIKKYQQFEDEIKKDVPAVFLYSPNFIYVVPQKLKNAEIKSMIYPSDIFANVFSWYVNTEKVWKIFAKK